MYTKFGAEFLGVLKNYVLAKLNYVIVIQSRIINNS